MDGMLYVAPSITSPPSIPASTLLQRLPCASSQEIVLEPPQALAFPDEVGEILDPYGLDDIPWFHGNRDLGEEFIVISQSLAEDDRTLAEEGAEVGRAKVKLCSAGDRFLPVLPSLLSWSEHRTWST